MNESEKWNPRALWAGLPPKAYLLCLICLIVGAILGVALPS